MKFNNYIFFLSISTIIAGLIVLSYFFMDNGLAILGLIDDDQVSATENYEAASINKGSILLLLLVGIIGFLGVSRRKKNTHQLVEKNRVDKVADNQSGNSNKE